tara:strand:- start:560 stop:1252 length:693 start_codon:yes stop_codon:yes gene_type:complete
MQKHDNYQFVLQQVDPSILEINYTQLAQTLKNEYFTPLRLEYLRSITTGNLKLEDGLIEYLLSKNINGKHIGEGNFPVDIKKDNKGIDVVCLCMNKNKTNEKSIIQNFKDAGESLDILFQNSQFNKALDIYKTQYYNKLLNAKNDGNFDEFYYCTFISTNHTIHLAVFKIHIDNIKNMTFHKSSKSSFHFNGFIDPQYGTTILYKSKKRLELRFYKNILHNNNTILIMNI